eukprot:2683902-Rhodomonas_salina.1
MSLKESLGERLKVLVVAAPAVSQEARFTLNTDALANSEFIFVTLLVSHPDMSPLNEEAKLNALCIETILPVFQPL